MASNPPLVPGVSLRAAHSPAEQAEVLTTEALAFLAELQRTFGPRREALLSRRLEVQAKLDAGETLHFLPATRDLREGDWRCAEIPPDLLDRRVEITGPVDRKMIINALNSGANTFMADFEDSTSPTWENLIVGQRNLIDAVRRTITFTNEAGKAYRLNDQTATLLVRPRGWHLPEKHLLVDDQPMSGSLFDFGLYFFHNAKALLQRGTGPYFYLPKLESHLEARLWNDVFGWAEAKLGIARGTIRATVLIETLPAAFEMDEILYELREHSAGLNCGRWDYIFSFIKKQRANAGAVLPDRSQVSMDKGFLRAYSQLLIQTCHRRGVHAMGGMAAQIPIKTDPAANEAALAKVRADKLREVKDGHDGTWVAHPGLVPVAKEVFDANMPGKNQLTRLREDVHVTPEDLLRPEEGTRTQAGLRHNIKIGLQYLEAWLGGQGCVPLYNLMEDAATAEISRAQVWQWIRHQAPLDDGQPVSRARFEQVLAEELAQIQTEVGETRFQRGKFGEAQKLFTEMALAKECPEFLTLPAYEFLLALAA